MLLQPFDFPLLEIVEQRLNPCPPYARLDRPFDHRVHRLQYVGYGGLWWVEISVL